MMRVRGWKPEGRRRFRGSVLLHDSPPVTRLRVTGTPPQPDFRAADDRRQGGIGEGTGWRLTALGARLRKRCKRNAVGSFHARKKTAFFAYPGAPTDVAQTIRSAIAGFNAASSIFKIEGWEKNDISGILLTAPIFNKITSCDFLAADVTYLNENVAFEIGYAIGSGKRCLLFVNSTVTGDRELANNIGIFDTLGYEQYDNSVALTKLLTDRTAFTPIEFAVAINHQQPVYIVEPAQKNDAHLILVSRTKKARWKYRSFTPDEDVRFRQWMRSRTSPNRPELSHLFSSYLFAMPGSTIFVPCLLRAFLDRAGNPHAYHTCN